MEIKKTNLWSYVKTRDHRKQLLLESLLSFKVQGCQFTKAYKEGRWDGLERLFNRTIGGFPTGLTEYVVAELEKSKIYPVVSDHREKPKSKKYNILGEAPYLRPDQKEAVEAILDKTYGIVRAATGSGKTVVAVATAKLLNLPTLFLVNQADLMHQAAEQYEKRTGLKAGKVGEGLWEIDSKFIVATIQTLHRGLSTARVKNLLDGIKVLFVDECHGVAARTHYSVVRNIKNAYFRIGLSGTPLDRTDGKNIKVIAAIGPIIYTITSGDAVEQSLLSRAFVRFVQPEGFVFEGFDRNLAGTYFNVYKNGIEFNKTRNALIGRICQKTPPPMLVFCNTVRHAAVLKDILTDLGIRTELVWGKWSGESRLEALRKLGKGSLEAIVSSPVFDTGVDIPALKSVVIAAGGKSPIKLLQRIGRGMRKTKDKDSFDVWDIFDTSHKFLTNHTWNRINILKREGFQYKKVQEKDLL